MENFIVSARKYRPSRFEDVIGQPQVTNTLKNALRTNQLAQAFLFCGPRGVGKTTCARILAKAVNCENLTIDFEPCNECAACEAFNNNQSFNIHELDAASNNSVEDIRSLIDQIRFAPQTGKKKIYIIDEVHMLSSSAFNAFLKTLEEPPSYAIFILATTEKHKIIPTILSRCQIFDFNRIQTDDIVTHLSIVAKKENIKAEKDALHLIARKAEGALRDALSMFDRISIFANGQIQYSEVIENLNILDYDYFFRITDFFLSEDSSSALLTFNQILQKGFDGENFLTGLADHFRNLLVAKDSNTIELMDFSENIRQRYLQQAGYTSMGFLLSGLSIITEQEIQYRTSKNRRLCVEMAILKLCFLPSAIQLSKDRSVEVKKKSQPDIEKPKPEMVTNQQVNEFPVQNQQLPKNEVPIPREVLKQQNGNSIKLSSLSDLKKEIQKNESEEKDIPQVEIVYEEIDHYAFQQVWKSYLQKLDGDKKIPVVKILETFPPEIKEKKTILIAVGNTTFYNHLNSEREEMSYFLKKELGKKSIDLIIRVDKTKSKAETNWKPYQAIDKFNHMVKKNPKLKDFKDRLKLDLDF
ncbi:MAG: DNA polymerase III subunit gamma/tau [Chitinophagales bacterium]|nr:DNA polymerase III subunit gamma/tau [Chitinophagales bacterium]